MEVEVQKVVAVGRVSCQAVVLHRERVTAVSIGISKAV